VKPTPGRPEWVEQLFARHFFSVSRVLEALVAGTSRMHWGTFVSYSVLPVVCCNRLVSVLQ
jgi:membrane protein DedA with SNARE-associated domain